MAGLAKTGYGNALIGTTVAKVAYTDEGYIANEGDTPAGLKSFQLNRVAAENSRQDNEAVLGFFLSMASATYDKSKGTMKVTWTVDDLEDGE